MLAWLILLTQISNVFCLCQLDCVSLSLELCSKCIEAQMLTRKEYSSKICNLWSQKECSVSEGFIISTREKYLWINSSYHDQVIISSINEFFWSSILVKFSDERNITLEKICQTENQNFQHFGFKFKDKMRENLIYIWAIGSFKEDFQGFVSVQIINESKSYSLTEAQRLPMPEVKSIECSQSNAQCPPWFWSEILPWETKGRLLQNCYDATCNICPSSDSKTWGDCSDCGTTLFLYQGLCWTFCPSGTVKDTEYNTCNKKDVYSLDLSLYDVISSNPAGMTLAADYNCPIPYPVLNRGYFFEICSRMSSDNFIMPYFFSVSGWIFVVDYQNTWNEILHWNLNYVNINNKYLELYDKAIEPNPFTLNEWNFFYLSQSTDWTYVYFSVSMNGGSTTTAQESINLNVIDNAKTLYVGAPSMSGSGYGFHGYLHKLQIYTDYQSNGAGNDYYLSSCSGSCSACPSEMICPSIHCISTQYEYFDGCQSCEACETSCVRASDCNLCVDYCDSCSSFSLCTSCQAYYFLGPSSKSCHSGGCPSGSYDNGNYQCKIDWTVIEGRIPCFSLILNKIQSNFKDTTYNTNTLAGATTDFYPKYDEYDPYPSKGRGYYFNGHSLMQVTSFMFNAEFSFSAWIYLPTSTSGIIFAKQINDSTFTKLMAFEINSSNKLQLSLYLTMSKTGKVLIGESKQLVYDSQWYNLAVCVSYAAPYSQIAFSIAGTTMSVDYYEISLLGLFLDYNSGYTATIGASQSTKGYGNFIKAFIYSIKIWNFVMDPWNYDHFLASCGYYPQAADSCLSTQPIEKYYDGNSWQTCKPNCTTKGCVKSDTQCNLCEFENCYLCDDWTGCSTYCDSSCASCNGTSYKDCITCANSTRVLAYPGQCYCTSSQYLISEVPYSCGDCYSACSTCVGPNYNDCLSCSGQSITLAGSPGFCSCNSTQYIKTKSPLECADCDSSCLTCSRSGKYNCLSCSSGFVLEKDGSCTCGEGKTFYNGYCTDCTDERCSNCTSSPDICLSCFSPFVIGGRGCVCPAGTKEENETCIDNILYVNESYSDNTFYLIFSENLNETLSTADISITVLADIQVTVTFEVKTVSKYDYYKIPVEFTPTNVNGAVTLQLFISKIVYGVSNSIIEQRLFNHSNATITGQPKSSEQIANEEIAAVLPTSTQKSLTSTIAFYGVVQYLWTQKSATLWIYVNMVQIIAFAPLMNIDIPSDIYDMLKGYISYKSIPNLGVWIYESRHIGPEPINKFYKYGYKSGLFVIAAGHMVWIALMFFALWGILLLLYLCIPVAKVRNVLSTKVLSNFQYSWLIKLWLQIYILTIAGAVIGINNPDASQSDYVADCTFSWLVFLLSWVINGLMTWFIWKNKVIIESGDENFIKKYSSLLEDFHCKKGFLSMCYYPWFLLRRSLYALILYNLADFPALQSVLNIILTLITIFYMIKYKPYKSGLNNQVEIAAEFVVLIVFIFLTPFIDTDLSVSAREAFQSIILLSMITFILYSYAILVCQYYVKIKVKLSKRKELKVAQETGIVVPTNLSDLINSNNGEECNKLDTLNTTPREDSIGKKAPISTPDVSIIYQKRLASESALFDEPSVHE
ncbi:unnamed protein product [Blepharisma stoltei]|uniref:TNFR-Cys domain-containing protein n=1 Tax=Blepharisma stoltei TaxID=1481888 RepID=A0AAU9JE35_9CILI|nr:unnamed protein product [Blepharisma stoltei]